MFRRVLELLKHSDPTNEYMETVNKARSLLEVIHD